jgi:hypothetical protein
LAFAVIVVTVVAYGAVAPFARVPLLRIDSFIPTMMAIVFVTGALSDVRYWHIADVPFCTANVCYWG